MADHCGAFSMVLVLVVFCVAVADRCGPRYSGVGCSLCGLVVDRCGPQCSGLVDLCEAMWLIVAGPFHGSGVDCSL